MTRRRRTIFASLAALALLFAQVVVSAHACPAFGHPAAAKAAAHHEGCHESAPPDGTNKNACEQHCQYGHASFDNAQPAPAAVGATGPALIVDLPACASSSDARPSWRLAPSAAPPPASILFGVLRI
jgi:hypothetical protein